MRYRIRSHYRGHPLPDMDVTTSSPRTAARELLDRADAGTEWSDLYLIEEGERPLGGVEAREWAEMVVAGRAHM